MIRALEGGCFCGLVRYACEGEPSHETICHCTLCRRTTGAPFVAWLTVPRASFRIVSGEPASFASSEHGTRSFCPRCGTQLAFASSLLPDEIDVTIGSLDDPEATPPRDHTHTRSRLRWVALAEQLPEHPGGRE